METATNLKPARMYIKDKDSKEFVLFASNLEEDFNTKSDTKETQIKGDVL